MTRRTKSATARRRTAGGGPSWGRSRGEPLEEEALGGSHEEERGEAVGQWRSAREARRRTNWDHGVVEPDSAEVAGSADGDGDGLASGAGEKPEGEASQGTAAGAGYVSPDSRRDPSPLPLVCMCGR